jgi:peroxiredoxin
MQLFGRGRAKRAVEAPSQITAGASLPDVEIEALLFQLPESGDGGIMNTDVKAAVLPLTKALGNGTTVLVGMPGAFTPTCSDKHLPGFIKQSDTLKGLGVERIAVVTTNDRYVNSAWNQAIEECMTTKSGLLMLSDADGDCVNAMGLVDDMGFGLGLRSKRFVVISEGGIVKHVLVDDGSDSLQATSAEKVVQLLSPQPVAANDGEENSAAVAAVGALVVAAALLFASQSGSF